MSYRLLNPLVRSDLNLLEARTPLYLAEGPGFVARASGAASRGRELYGQGKEVYGKAKGSYDRGKEVYNQARNGTEPPPAQAIGQPAGQPPPVRTPLSTATPGAPAKEAKGGGFMDRISSARKGDQSSEAFGKDLVGGGEAKSGLGKLLGWNKKTKLIDRVQDTVDLVGIVDPTGIADAANALTYAARGEWKQAATSALGIIPYLGDLGKVGKFAGRGAKVGGKAAKVELAAGKIAARGAEKSAVRAGEKAAIHGTEKGVSKLDKIKGAYNKGKEVYARVQDAGSKIQARRDAEGGGGPPERTPLSTPTATPTTAPQPEPNADLGRRPTGPLSGAAPEPSMASPDPGPMARGREAAQRAPAAAPPQRSGGGGGASKGSGGATEVPVDADCPGEKTKTTTWKATPGMKRCAAQTPGRDHGD